MLYETRKQSMACIGWKRITLKIYALLMEDKMAAGAFGRARSYGWEGFPYFVPLDRRPVTSSIIIY